MRRAILVGLLALAGACLDTGQARVALPLYLAGADLSQPIALSEEVSLDVERAELAFGPLYLCAGATAGELCETARLEWLGSQVVDLTSQTPVRAGELTGVTGNVRSYMYDLGISSQLTRSEPYVLEAAEQLEGASLRLALRARFGERELPLTVAIPVQQSDATELGVPVIRKSAGARFEHDVRSDEPGLLIRFDAVSWLRGLDLSAYRVTGTCEAGGPERVCAQDDVELSCTAEGTVATERACATLGQTCLRGAGCVEALRLEADSGGYRTLRNALVSGARPSFEWGFVP